VDAGPGGFEIKPARGRAELISLSDLLFNSTNLIAVPHVLMAAFLTAAAAVIGCQRLTPRPRSARGGDARVAA
jgi:cytochrome bd-type quinol oxidase subunit 1